MAGCNISFGDVSLSETQGKAFSGIWGKAAKEIEISAGVISHVRVMKNGQIGECAFVQECAGRSLLGLRELSRRTNCVSILP